MRKELVWKTSEKKKKKKSKKLKKKKKRVSKLKKKGLPWSAWLNICSIKNLAKKGSTMD